MSSTLSRSHFSVDCLFEKTGWNLRIFKKTQSFPIWRLFITSLLRCLLHLRYSIRLPFAKVHCSYYYAQRRWKRFSNVTELNFVACLYTGPNNNNNAFITRSFFAHVNINWYWQFPVFIYCQNKRFLTFLLTTPL